MVEDPVGSIVISHGFTEVIDKYNEIIYYFLKMVIQYLPWSIEDMEDLDI